MTTGKKIAALILTVALIFSVTGCGGSIDASKFTENTLIINKDGSVTEVSVDSFGEDYYSQEDLEKYVNEEVDAYNREHPSASGKDKDKIITVDTVKADESSARVVLTYKDAQAYSDFNYADLQCVKGSEISGDAAALTFKNEKGEHVGALSAIEKPEDHSAVIVQGPVQVAVSGKIAYVSDQVTVTDKSTAKCESGLAVIIYK